jgi:hypothetical protein
MAQDSGAALDQLDGVFVDAPQDESALVRREGETDAEVGLPAASLTAVEQLVGLAKIGVALRPRIGDPG